MIVTKDRTVVSPVFSTPLASPPLPLNLKGRLQEKIPPIGFFKKNFFGGDTVLNGKPCPIEIINEKFGRTIYLISLPTELMDNFQSLFVPNS